ncbi:MAG: hypothetical protein F4X12_13130 [Acidobacteriia bacterium]|nr:hypothetical protein [Terriglobia bacterium]
MSVPPCAPSPRALRFTPIASAQRDLAHARRVPIFPGLQATGPADPNASYVEMPRQATELRSEVLDERKRQIGQQMEANSASLVFFGIVIGVTGLWIRSKL